MKPTTLAAILYAFAGLAGMSAIGLGAFAAHALAKIAPTGDRGVALFQQGTDFQLKHTLALILITILADRISPGIARHTMFAAAGFMVAGIVLFPAALYAAAFDKPHFYAPWGGTAAMTGWLLFAVGALLTLTQSSTP
jgi:uncharacterized membrane protein YgdD (TMEM256/DUF423 family)